MPLDSIGKDPKVFTECKHSEDATVIWNYKPPHKGGTQSIWETERLGFPVQSHFFFFEQCNW